MFLRQSAHQAGSTPPPLHSWGARTQRRLNPGSGAGTEMVTVSGGKQEDWKAGRLHPGVWVTQEQVTCTRHAF